MKPIKTLKNQYRGINAHLHSQLQNHGWAAFHTNHISDLARLFKKQLIPMGYTASVEPSLQIIGRQEAPRYPESDVTVFDTDPVRAKSGISPVMEAVAPETRLSIETMLKLAEPDKKIQRAIGLYELNQESRHPDGDPVAWVELLSPSNKPGGRHFEAYLEKRERVLQSGLVFVEIDYLHESNATFDGVAAYHPWAPHLPHDPRSHPYRIAVIDPRPDFEKGEGRIREFDVDTPIPAMKIPLNNDDILDFDFGIPYRKTFEEMFYGTEVVDYAQLPLNFERYSDIDRLRILLRMLTLMDAVQQKIPLDEPLPLKFTDLSLEEARQKLERIANLS